MDEKYLKLTEVLDRLTIKVSRRTLIKRINAGAIPGARRMTDATRSHWVVPESSFIEYENRISGIEYGNRIEQSR